MNYAPFLSVSDCKNRFREEGDTKMCDTKQGQQLRSSLRKTHTSDQNGSKDADPDKVSFELLLAVDRHHPLLDCCVGRAISYG